MNFIKKSIFKQISILSYFEVVSTGSILSTNSKEEKHNNTITKSIIENIFIMMLDDNQVNFIKKSNKLKI